MADRIATFTQTNQLILGNTRLQSNYAERQLQVASGFKADNYAGIARDTSRLLSLESDVDRITQQAENTQIVADRLDLMYDALGSILSQTQKFAADLTSTVSGFGLQGADLANVATTNLNRVAGSLNTQIADRYLFAGSATQSPPVDLTDPAWGGQTFILPGPSVADFDYYQGNNYIQNVEAVDGFTIGYGVNADNPALEKIIRAYDLIITNPTDQDTLFEALSVIQAGADELAILQATVAQDANTVQAQLLDNQEEVNLITAQITTIREVDVAEASVRLKQIETQLEASYTVTSTLLNLKLSDYIR